MCSGVGLHLVSGRLGHCSKKKDPCEPTCAQSPNRTRRGVYTANNPPPLPNRRKKAPDRDLEKHAMQTRQKSNPTA